MTVRIWEGQTRLEHSEVYTKIIEERDIPDYKKTKGFVKLSFLKRDKDGVTYFRLLTYWIDLATIANFTGPNLEEAKYYEDDRQYLIDFPGTVSHYLVFAE